MLDIAEGDCGDDDSGAPYEPAIACCEYGCECEGECGRPDGCGCEWDEYEEVCACECERGAAQGARKRAALLVLNAFPKGKTRLELELCR